MAGLTPEQKSAYQRAYRARNAETLREKKAKYYAERREHFIRSFAEYREKNREKLNAYDKARRAADPEKKRAIDRAYREKNRDAINEKRAPYFKARVAVKREYDIQYRDANKGRLKTRQLDYYEKNKPAYLARVVKRNAQKLMAAPRWADHAAIEEVYREAEYMQMDVDHMVPLQSPLVCGLHVVDNLQLLPRSENRSKGNRYWPDMP